MVSPQRSLGNLLDDINILCSSQRLYKSWNIPNNPPNELGLPIKTSSWKAGSISSPFLKLDKVDKLSEHPQWPLGFRRQHSPLPKTNGKPYHGTSNSSPKSLWFTMLHPMMFRQIIGASARRVCAACWAPRRPQTSRRPSAWWWSYVCEVWELWQVGLGTMISWCLYDIYVYMSIIEGSLEVKLPTIWTDEKQSRAEAERRERLEERRVEEKESEERRYRCAKR